MRIFWSFWPDHIVVLSLILWVWGYCLSQLGFLSTRSNIFCLLFFLTYEGDNVLIRKVLNYGLWLRLGTQLYRLGNIMVIPWKLWLSWHWCPTSHCLSILTHFQCFYCIFYIYSFLFFFLHFNNEFPILRLMELLQGIVITYKNGLCFHASLLITEMEKYWEKYFRMVLWLNQDYSLLHIAWVPWFDPCMLL